MKKVKLLVASIIMALSFSTIASAAIPANTIIIGGNAYSMDYISKNLGQLSDILNNSTQYQNIYYVNGSNNVVNLFTGDTLTPSNLSNLSSSLTYYDSYGTKSVYSRSGDSTSGYSYSPDATSSVINAKITVTSIGTMYFVSVKLPDASKVNVTPYTLTPKYFKVINNSSNNSSALIKTIGTPDSVKGESDDDYTLNLITTDLSLRLQILSSDKVPIATTEGKVISATGAIQSVDFKLDSYYTSPTSYTYTNSNGLGNLNNTGLANQSSGWIYYTNPGDGGGIYKTNGVQSYKICEDNAKFINVVGDWIYYSNYGDGQKIYKVRTDGTGRRIVCTDQASYVVVSGEYIYYSYHSGTGIGNIKKISRDALKSTGTVIANDEAEYLTISGDMIYYTNKSEGNSIYSVSVNGGNRTKIASDSAKFITFANSQIYYITDAGQLKWISKTGGSFGSIQVSNGSTGLSAVIGAMNITSDGKWMYYTDASDGNKVYRAPIVNYLRISGDKYADSYADFIGLAGDKVYYTKGNAMFIANEPTISSSTNSSTPGTSVYKYSSTAVTKIAQPLKVVSYDKVATPTKNAVGSNTSNLEDYLPDKITAVLSDNSVHEVLVDWDLNPKQTTNSAKTQYTGVVVGYGSKVSLSLSMASEPIPAASVKVINNAGLLDDKIYVNKDDKGVEMSVKAGLQLGDVIKVYRDSSKSELLGQDTIIPSLGGGLLNSTITLSQNKTITDDAKYVYVTRTSPGVLESDPVQVPISGVSGTPVFAINSSDVKLTNYGTLPNGLSENDIVEIPATTELQQGDIVNIYKSTKDNGKIKIASQMVQYVPSADPFSQNKFAVTMSVPAGYIEYDNTSDIYTGKNLIYITKSTQFAESSWDSAIQVPITPGVALPLGQLIVSGSTASGVFVRTQLDSQYQYYYKVGGSIPTLGADITSDATWLPLNVTTPSVNAVNGDDVYVLQTYGGKALRCSHTTAVVTP